ncbi:MAG: hypothetical protein ABJE47_01525 [bacterium]
MSARKSRAVVPVLLLAALAFTACKNDATTGPKGNDPISSPSGPLNLGDVVSLNVNGTDPCTNAVPHGVKVMAIGTHAMIMNDTLNPKNGFSTADYQRFAARFDTLVYPLDVSNFGEPTDIDKNGKIGIIFTRAVNELTPARSTQYVGGFTFSRDLFPRVGTERAQACAGSNEGEYFYLLAPDPSGTVNSNVRTTNFVDSVTTAVLAHEFQHLINASRRLYVNNTPTFEAKWLDEGLAHVAEELLFNAESGLSPRSNLDINAVRATSAIRTAYNADMSGNQGRYRTYLTAPSSSSPYAADDSLSTRGAAWSLLRYAIDRVDAVDGFGPGTGQSIAGTGSVTLTPGATNGDYSITLVNTTLQSIASLAYTLNTATSGGATGSVSPSLAIVPSTLSAMIVPVGDDPGALRNDVAFESRLRARERVVLTPMMSSARNWYAAQDVATPSATRLRASLSLSSQTDVDGPLWFRLVNSSDSGAKNLQAIVGGNLASFVRDWSVSHAIDDVAAPATQFQQRSWNWHSIYPNLGAGGSPYPLLVQPLGTNGIATGAVVAGGATYFKLSIPSNGSVTVSLTAPAGATGSNLQLIAVRTK